MHHCRHGSWFKDTCLTFLPARPADTEAFLRLYVRLQNSGAYAIIVVQTSAGPHNFALLPAFTHDRKYLIAVLLPAQHWTTATPASTAQAGADSGTTSSNALSGITRRKVALGAALTDGRAITTPFLIWSSAAVCANGGATLLLSACAGLFAGTCASALSVTGRRLSRTMRAGRTSTTPATSPAMSGLPPWSSYLYIYLSGLLLFL